MNAKFIFIDGVLLQRSVITAVKWVHSKFFVTYVMLRSCYYVRLFIYSFIQQY
uniref:Uncharacterized protein n=1 Tax=Anguilla anguilla TaxID=7936 RepID=A0A0E9RT51_ANGAN